MGIHTMMKTFTSSSLFAASALLVAICGAEAQTKQSAPAVETKLAAGDLRRSGTIQFEVTCAPAVREDFLTALALLHSFFYEEARARFEDIAKRDPNCAMAHWGVAMTWYHPIWAPPTAEQFEKGREAARTAKKMSGGSAVERGLIDAIAAYYESDQAATSTGPVAQTCHGPREHSSRAMVFKQALERLRQQHPDEAEVNVFYALSLLGTALPSDETYANQLQATAILEPLFEKHPDHPGIAHYIIHAYDYAPLATRGLEAARRYAEIAPWVPHALHMPSHIYSRLGMWKESIESNRASVAAAREWAARVHGGATVTDDIHALDYLAFSYLQTGREKAAGEIVEHVAKIQRFTEESEFAIGYAVGAIPARWTLERKRWSEAAELPLRHENVFKRFPAGEAHIQFARAIGAARSGKLEAASAAVARLEQIRDSLKEDKGGKTQWWGDHAEMQRLSAAGWMAKAKGDSATAEKLLREAAALEDRMGSHPVTPGQILPAREQLAELLAELGRPADALAEFESSLKNYPNRFNAHFGAGRAAEKAGQPAVARKHYQHAIELAGEGDGRREELATARAFLAQR
jgi:tetratricopeptide (TPR) repeat protein